MKALELKKQLKTIPDDADVSYSLIFDKCSKCDKILDLNHVALAFTFGSELMQVHIDKEYEGLPKSGGS